MKTTNSLQTVRSTVNLAQPMEDFISF